MAADPGGAEAQAADRAAAAPAEDGATGQALGAEEAPAAEDEEVRGGKEERGGGAGGRRPAMAAGGGGATGEAAPWRLEQRRGGEVENLS